MSRPAFVLNNRLAFRIVLAALFFWGAGYAADSSLSQNPEAKSLVVVTDSLDIDFSKHIVTFIELGADRCIPCKAMQPIMKEIAAEYEGQVRVVFYDV